MPLYSYEHPETQEVVDIIQGMNDDHVFVDDDGVNWKRIFYIPQANVDSQVDPFSSKSFKDKTANQKGTYGDIVDQSKEMSQRRKDKLGYDPVQQKYFKEYSDKRNGIKHHLDRG